MGNIIRYCHTCTHWVWDENVYLPDGSVAYPGHCGLYSAKCINEVPVWFPGSPKPVHYQQLEVPDD